MNNLVEFVIDIANSRGAKAADVRIVSNKNEEIQVRNGVPVRLSSIDIQGVGVNVCLDDGWGFACSYKLDKPSLEKVVARAFEVAESSAALNPRMFSRARESVHIDSWKQPIRQDPFRVPLEEKLHFFEKIQEECFKVKGVKTVLGEMGFQMREQYFGNLEGSRIYQKNCSSGCGYVVIASNGKDIQVRSYPNSFGGQWEAAGFELMLHWPWIENAGRVSEEAVALLTAPACPPQTCDVILDSSQLAIQLHQTCGQPAELDRILGYEANFSGTSFLDLEHRSNLAFGNETLNVFTDPGAKNSSGAGGYVYDDEGVPAHRTDLIKDGVFTSFMTSRNTAPLIDNEKSTGHARASNWNRIPIIRMTNINIAPGDKSLDELIEDTKNGVLLETNKSWSIDDHRHNFQFGTEIGWEIRNGKRGRMLKNPVYQGAALEFWRSCDAVCDKNEWKTWGSSNFGKGQPEQIISSSVGAAPARFRKVNVGSGKNG
mgnify:CR=1 FL=1